MPPPLQYGNKRQKKQGFSTALHYDNFHQQDIQQDHENDTFAPRLFTSSRTSRFSFKQQNKRDFQDSDDIANELLHCNVLPNFKDMTGTLDIEPTQFEDYQASNTTVQRPISKTHNKNKVKIRFNHEDEYQDEDEDGNGNDAEFSQPLNFQLKLKTIDQKIKFKKEAIISSKTTLTDPIYKQFIKCIIKPIIHTSSIVPQGFVPRNKGPLGIKDEASTKLKSRFTTATNQETHSGVTASTKPQFNTAPNRITYKITVNPIIMKRLSVD